jgi:hypothetical protein
MVECTYTNDSMVTGFQMIAQLRDVSKVHRLSNRTTDHQIPASVMVEENGTYQVTVFAIKGGRGILDSIVEYSEKVIVETSVVDTTTSVATDTTMYTTTSGM